MSNPNVRVGGKLWEVRPIVIKQLRVIQPCIGRIRASGLFSDKERMASPSEAELDDILTVIYQAIAPGAALSGKPISFDEFTNMQSPLHELYEAMIVIGGQTGFVRALEGEISSGGDGASGESTGTA